MPTRLSARLRLLAHRSGLIASPTLAYLGVPFGLRKRDLAREITQRLTAPCATGCLFCEPDPDPDEL